MVLDERQKYVHAPVFIDCGPADGSTGPLWILHGPRDGSDLPMSSLVDREELATRMNTAAARAIETSNRAWDRRLREQMSQPCLRTLRGLSSRRGDVSAGQKG